MKQGGQSKDNATELWVAGPRAVGLKARDRLGRCGGGKKGMSGGSLWHITFNEWEKQEKRQLGESRFSYVTFESHSLSREQVYVWV